MQNQNCITNLKILKDLKNLNPKLVFELSSVQELYLQGGMGQMVRLQIPLTQQVISLLLKKFKILPNFQAELREIESKNISFDYIF